ncbi:MAG: HAMP domain-containing histidine kinase, partial [Elusimicrobiales bacterium]|nr:HAMP domain-containing histidine kinase [Elusimicrobiales bacterium]
RENAKLNSDMVSAVSHEFNNLLTGLNLTALLLEEGEGEKVDKERLNLYKMHRYNYTAMSEQIKVFLNKSKLESGNVKLDITKTDIKNVIDSTVNHFLPIAYQKNIKIIRDFPKTHPFVQCDVDLISLAVSNILSNAIKYSPKNKNIIIRVRRVEKKFLKISIKDSGIGIDKDDFDKIFTGFYRTKKSMQHTTGFGIGLKMTKQIIELHNSTLRIASESGEGSEFHFLLPTYEG